MAAADRTVLATMEERFAIRGRTGAGELTDPAQAARYPENATDTPRRRRRDVTLTAPVDMRPFAVVSGDRNPIHTDRAAALLAGLESPIVHGMWLSAAAQHVVTATDGQARPPARLIGWTARFLGMVRPGDEVDFRVDRVGIDRGRRGFRGVAARIGSGSGDVGDGTTGRAQDCLRIPGPGHSAQGHGHGSPGPLQGRPQGMDDADKYTRETLGFSILHVVRDNPTSLIASGVHYNHPEGVLYLTQFTQVAMATVASAQVAEMREQGAFVEEAIACGHSVGEYTALACVSDIYGLEALLERCFSADPPCMTSCRATSWAVPTTGWPRSGRRRSTWTTPSYRGSSRNLRSAPVNSCKSSTSTCAARSTPSRAPCAVSKSSRPRSSGVAKSPAANRSFILVPGIDVPFHSEVLRVGVADSADRWTG